MSARLHATSMAGITVLKLDLSGAITWQYEGRILRRDSHTVVLEALFNLPDSPVVDVMLQEGDRFVETFYTHRWYNIFEIHDRDRDRLKGWYCNVSRPAQITDDAVSWVDLALDLWVWPDGRQAVIDQDEFLALGLLPSERDQALSALAELQRGFGTQRPPL